MLDDYLTNNVSKIDFSVSEISSKIKWLLENNLGTVRIKGEISGLKIAKIFFKLIIHIKI
jgi:exodeoxyribonuclease VII large subunit